jgi:ligand-binding SRPBCC domain-containing protein
MAVYRRSTRVDAPLERVWAFHSRIEGLEALTPGWMGLSVESVRGPDGDPDPDVLQVGSEIRMAMRPLGVGPPQRWTARIVARERDDGSAWFRDEMVDGPFDRWVHTHRFFADGDSTIVDDRVEYRLPGGSLGQLADPLAWVGFEPMFRFRHRRTRNLLESESGGDVLGENAVQVDLGEGSGYGTRAGYGPDGNADVDTDTDAGPGPGPGTSRDAGDAGADGDHGDRR